MENTLAEEITYLNVIFKLTLATAITVCVASLAYFRGLFLGKGSSNLPPGPFRIPILGNLLQMVKDPHLKLSQWAQSYGDLCTIYMGTKPALLVSEPKLMKELFGTPASTGKFKTDTFLLISRGSFGILNTEGKAWEEQRNFCIRSLKEVGFGSGRSMEPLILREVNEVCDWIKGTTKMAQLYEVLQQGTVNALWTIVSGERFKLGDSEIAILMKRFVESIQYTVKTGLGFFPWLKYLAPKLSGYADFDLACENMHEFFESKFRQHEKTYVEGQRRDLIDTYIEHLKYTEKNLRDSGFFGKAGWINSVSSVSEIFLAGAETTSVNVNWALIYLAHDQNSQARLHTEIDEIVGKDRDPSLDDRGRMPFTEAVILETLRMASVGPMGIIHELLEDLQFHGYTLPKGMLLIANLYHIHHNPEIWGDPENFRPERFLWGGEEGESLREFLVPFQAGKRQCLGEPLARDILFLFVTKLLQQFHITPDKRVSKKEYLNPDVGIMLLPKPLGLVMTARCT